VESIENQLAGTPEQPKAADRQDVQAREDARLLVAIAEGDQHALAALYRHRGSLLYSLLLRMLVNETEAQEAMQDTFLHIWRRAGNYDSERSSPVAWMLMIARGLAMDRLRARSRRNAGLAAYEQEVASLEVEVNSGTWQTERDELADACAAALNSLPEPQGRALQLAFFRGWTHEEISKAVGEPLGTVKARIRRGLLALRQVLKDYHG
jgi:RNA polymerase sigma-70 factor (ECF subfamily)